MSNNNNINLSEGFNDDFDNYKRVNDRRDGQRENRPFVWPGNIISGISKGSKVSGENKMVRGFMRSILTDKNISAKFNGKPGGNYRLNFQFNPDYIERSVTQSVGAINPILQAPGQLTQPVPGTATFSFTMTFNREMEVNRAGFDKNNTAKQFLYGPGTDAVVRNNTYDTFKNNTDPSLVGVWADLQMFDLIIGQGITEELLELVGGFTSSQDKNKDAAEIAAIKAANAKLPAGERTPEPSLTPFDTKAFNQANSANFGNSAFINPLPVRVVFSDVFMVEGLVTSSSVAFQKFNQNMIPTVCQVNVNMMALYAGFAKKEAYLTTSLTNWASAEGSEQAATDSANKSAQMELNQKIRSFNVLFNASLDDDFKPEPGKSGIDGDNNTYLKTGAEASFMMRSHTQSTVYYPGNSTNPRFMTFQQFYNILYTKHWGGNIGLDDAGVSNPKTLLTSKQLTNKETLPIVITVVTTKPNFVVDLGWNITCTLSYPLGAKKTATQVVSMSDVDGPQWKLGIETKVGSLTHQTYYKEFFLTIPQLKDVPKFNSTVNTNYLVNNATLSFTIQGKGTTTNGLSVSGSVSGPKAVTLTPNTPLFYNDGFSTSMDWKVFTFGAVKGKERP